MRGGATVPIAVYALRKDGFAGEIELALKDAPAGFSLAECRKAGYENLRALGFSGADLRAAGLDAAGVRAAGFARAADLVGAGFTFGELCGSGKLDGKPYSSLDLATAVGFSASYAGSSDLSVWTPDWKTRQF